MERHTKIGKYPFTDSEVAELREYFGKQIAKEIEAESEMIMTPTGCTCGREITAPMDFIAKSQAVAIARGEDNG
jgi:L-fucose isomerase-like protein